MVHRDSPRGCMTCSHTMDPTEIISASLLSFWGLLLTQLLPIITGLVTDWTQTTFFASQNNCCKPLQLFMLLVTLMAVSSAVFGIEEPLSIFQYVLRILIFFNIDVSIWTCSILKSIEHIEHIEEQFGTCAVMARRS